MRAMAYERRRSIQDSLLLQIARISSPIEDYFCNHVVLVIFFIYNVETYFGSASVSLDSNFIVLFY